MKNRLTIWPPIFGAQCRPVWTATALVLATFILHGCAQPDRRLVEDRQTCLAMGHQGGTPEFQQCMADLNERRCPTKQTRHGQEHVVSKECTQSP